MQFTLCGSWLHVALSNPLLGIIMQQSYKLLSPGQAIYVPAMTLTCMLETWAILAYVTVPTHAAQSHSRAAYVHACICPHTKTHTQTYIALKVKWKWPVQIACPKSVKGYQKKWRFGAIGRYKLPDNVGRRLLTRFGNTISLLEGYSAMQRNCWVMVPHSDQTLSRRLPRWWRWRSILLAVRVRMGSKIKATMYILCRPHALWKMLT